MAIGQLTQKNKVISQINKRKKYNHISRLSGVIYKPNRIVILFIIALIFFTFIQFLGALRTGLAYKADELEIQLNHLEKTKRNYELSYEKIANPINLKNLANHYGFIQPKKIFTVSEYILIFKPETKNDP